jgi:hypothetical protein
MCRMVRLTFDSCHMLLQKRHLSCWVAVCLGLSLCVLPQQRPFTPLFRLALMAACIKSLAVLQVFKLLLTSNVSIQVQHTLPHSNHHMPRYIQSVCTQTSPSSLQPIAMPANPASLPHVTSCERQVAVGWAAIDWLMWHTQMNTASNCADM